MMGKPKIRFKGYNEDWEQRKLGEVVEFFNGDRSSRYPNDSDMVPEGIPFINAGDLVSGRVKLDTANKITEEKYNELSGAKIQRGDIIYCLRGTLGKNAFVDNFDAGTVASSLVDIRPKKIVGKYLFQVLNSDIEYRQRTVNDEGAAQPNLSAKNLSLFDIPMPSEFEQEKIALYFDTLDHLITLHQHKCDEMKKLKKYMLQKMFPKNGKKVPEIRFDGFTNDWEQRKFSELVMIERGGSPRPIDKYITKAENGLNWVKIGDAPEQSNYITKTSEKIIPEGLSKTREVHPGDLILSNSMSFGRPYIMAIDGCIHDGWLAIRDTEKRFDLKFLCTLLGTDSMLNQYKAMAAGSTVNNLNKELVGSTIVSFPKMDEQTKIGEYFTNLDHLITLHQHKCDELQNFKKYMLQNMFV